MKALIAAVVAIIASLTLSTSMAAAPSKVALTMPETVETSINGPVLYSDPYVIYEITEYTSGYESTQKHPGEHGYGITASGTTARPGVVACPRSIPYGSTVYIPTMDATYVCQDRGSRITDGHIDIYVRDVRTAEAFGRRLLPVEITMKDGDDD